MAVLSKTFVDKSVHHGSLENEISFISNKLFFETFPNIILHLQAFCSPSSCLELHYLLNHHLHRDIDGESNKSRMAVPVFDSIEHYFKKVNVNDSNVIRHLIMFKSAITALFFRDYRSAEKNFSRVLFHLIKGNSCKARAIKEKKSREFGSTRTVELPVLRLRGGAGGDKEKWLCEICGKLLMSKRNLDHHMASVHVSHLDFDCIMSDDGLLKWQCSLCSNLLSSKQRIISHLVKTHGKMNLLGQEHRQNLHSRTTLWRRKRSADGSFVDEQCFSKSYPQVNSSQNFASCSAIENKSPVPAITKDFTERDLQTTEDITERPVITELSEVSGQDEPFFASQDSYYDLHVDSEYPPGKDTDIISMDDSFSSDSDSSSSNNDYSSSETEATSSDDSDFDDHEDQLQTAPTDSVKEFSEKEKLSVLILSYIAKHKLNGSASVDLLELLKLIAPKDNNLHSLTLSEIKETLGDCLTNIYDYCSKCFSIFPKDENIYQCSTTDGKGKQCSGLRYRGNVRNQAKKEKNLYFVTISMEQQLGTLLQHSGIWTKIRQYKKLPNCLNIRDIVDGTEYKKYKQSGGFLTNEDNLTLLFNTDGISLYKSSKVNIWPVFLAINELPPNERFVKKNMILWGLWQGKGKPRFSTFFEVFTEDLITLKHEGLTVTDKCHPKLMLSLGSTDLQGKAYLLSMSHHNGECGCSTCEEEGFTTKQGKGHVRCYPFRDPPATLRTSDSVLENALSALESNKRVKGIYDVTPLAKLPWFDLVLGIVPDYMHGVLLGVTKQLLNLWLSSSKYKKPWFIGNKTKAIDKRLKEMKPPDFIQRLPRQLETSRAYFKASELQAWLLYYSVPCLIDILPERYLQHFACLVEGVYILLGDNITPELLAMARDLLFRFYKDHQVLYGDSNCSLNVHNVGAHLAMYVQSWGPLWAWSCFPLEDLNGTLLEGVHGTGNQCRQLIWMLYAQNSLRANCHLIPDVTIQQFVERMLSGERRLRNVKKAANCQIAGALRRWTADDNIYEQACLLIDLNCIRRPIFQVAKRVIVNAHIIYSRLYEKRKKHCGYAVLIEHNGGNFMAYVQYFLYESNSKTVFAVLKRIILDLENPFLVSDKPRHLLRTAGEEQRHTVVLVDSILEKVICLTGNSNHMCVSRAPNFCGHCR